MIQANRDLYVITAAEFVAILGFTIIAPFLPYYVQELGVRDPAAVKLWSGLIYSLPSITLSLISPFWGALADRYGKKLMVERAMFGGALVFAGMGLAKSLLALSFLRAVQGLLSGTVPAATSLVASKAPRGQAGSSLGRLQTGIYLGASFGPFVGGILADVFGYRSTFFFTSGCLLVAGIAVHRWVHEESPTRPNSPTKDDARLWDGLLAILKARDLRRIFTLRLSNRIGLRLVTPMLPLFIQEISMREKGLGLLTGSVVGLSAFASVFGSFILGRASDRVGHRKLLMMSFVCMAILSALQVLVVTPLQLTFLQVVLGFLIAGVIVSISSMMVVSTPGNRHGAVFGLDTTFKAASNAVAPLLAANIAIWWGLRSIFLISALIYILGAITTRSLKPVMLNTEN